MYARPFLLVYETPYRGASTPAEEVLALFWRDVNRASPGHADTPSRWRSNSFIGPSSPITRFPCARGASRSRFFSEDVHDEKWLGEGPSHREPPPGPYSKTSRWMTAGVGGRWSPRP